MLGAMPRVSTSPRSGWALAAECALWELAIGVPLALGGAPRWVLTPVVMISCTAFACVCVHRLRLSEAVQIPPIAWGLIASSVFCVVQLVPLWPGLLAWLSPPAAELQSFALE